MKLKTWNEWADWRLGDDLGLQFAYVDTGYAGYRYKTVDVGPVLWVFGVRVFGLEFKYRTDTLETDIGVRVYLLGIGLAIEHQKEAKSDA